MMKQRFISCLFLLVTLQFILILSTPSLAQDTDKTLTLTTVDGERLFHLHTPPQAEEEAIPLVIALHPIASSGHAMQAITGLNDAADQYGFAVAYPEALSFYWDDGRAAAGMVADDGEIDDVGFISAMIDVIAQETDIHTDQVHLTGLGNGGTMAYRLACQLPGRFASVAVVGALMWDYQPDNCPPGDAPINMLIIHGSDDSTYRIDGRTFPPGEAAEEAISILSLEETIRFWMAYDHCEAEPTAYNRAPLTTYTCQDEAAIHAYTIISGENGWPRMGDDLRLNQFGIDTTTIIARYFMEGVPPLDDMTQTTPPPTELARSYQMYIPTTYTFDEAVPLVMVLHGRPGSAGGIALITDMNTIAEENGFIVVYPEGMIPPSETARGWNYVRDVPLFRPADSSAISQRDDVQFLVDLVHDIAEIAPIDTDRAYVTGFSNGGFMTQRLACDASGTFAAFAAAGSTLSWGMTEICEGKPPIPLLMMHGTDDISVPWTGTTGNIGGQQIYVTAPIPNTVVFWAQHNGCGQVAPEQENIPSSGDSPETSVIFVRYTQCEEPLTFVGVTGGGHNWPGVPGRIGEQIAGDVNLDIHAGQVVWDFMSQFTLDEARIEAAEAAATPSAPIIIDETAATESAEVRNAREVVATLQRGGFIVYYRHGEQNPDYTDETCTEPGALTDNGDDQATLLATVLERLTLHVDHVLTTGTCAAQQSIARTFSEAVAEEATRYEDTAALQEALSAIPQADAITLMVGDGNLLEALTGQSLGPAETLIVRPTGTNFEVLTIASVYDWLYLANLVDEDPE
ncbi:hypothetical protein G4Y79_19935 [Phototrophicus methaneseepsis]|uniref:Poly(3-hydroxybutyrate) depolymerase n=1 Tax=Phototrophicus methaneseepsis TaxID=2710758 RepID=A0A7S8E7T8_9CHLR|nr:PHB depolymerase family esterase [Phototrophicus methaneseepsis]QPC81935.1 hypothetical protein G4Y79_19935 [Phototrophicus methaneseepsis]